MKKIAMMLAAGCAIGMLTGCGIPEEEHNAMIADLEAKHAKEVDKLTGDIADKDSIIKSEKAKVRTGRIELDDASERIKGLQQKSAETTKELATTKAKLKQIETDIASAKSATLAAQDQAMEADKKFNALEVEYKELKKQLENYRKNMGSFGGSSSSTTASAPADKDAPKTDSQKASSLLDEMGNL
ncbi:MAG: hypothetical protein OES84_01665 [Kiritimatiellaceae bacterium]|nr:hypothetical protein [Kiritimatiellaceae bacterium]